MPRDQHLVVIEDTFELVTGWIGDASRLESDESLSLADLVKNSLRMRPERIIIGHGDPKKCVDFAREVGSRFRCETIAPKNLETIRVK